MAVYLVPKNVRARFELIPGLGLPELGLCGAGALVGIVFAGLAALFGASFLLRMVFFVIPIGLMFFATRGGIDGESLYVLAVLYRRWRAGRKRYVQGGGV